MSPHVCSVEPSTRTRNSRTLGSSVDWPDATLCRGPLPGSIPPPPPRPPTELRMKYPITRTTTPPIPKRLMTSGIGQPRPPPPIPPPPNPPKPEPPCPVRSSKLLLSGSPPSRIRRLLPLPNARGARAVANATETVIARGQSGATDDSRRQSRPGRRNHVGHRPRDRPRVGV